MRLYTLCSNTSQTQSPTPKPTTPSSGQTTSNINGDVYIADGDYIKDIEVNDLRNRYTLTKGSTQKMVNILVISTDTPRPQQVEHSRALLSRCFSYLFGGRGSLLAHDSTLHSHFCTR